MELVAEQVKYLRERRRELLERKKEYREIVANRERSNIERSGLPIYEDNESLEELYRIHDELQEVQNLLEYGRYKRGRNYDLIDIGTIFSIELDDGYRFDNIMLIDDGTPSFSRNEVKVSSNIGKAVLGKGKGSVASYIAPATGRKEILTVTAIDNVRSHYNHFITEKSKYDRMSSQAREEFRSIAKDSDEYKVRHQYTISQLFLINEEIDRLNRLSSPEKKRRKAMLENYLKSNTLVEPPKDNTIGIGSIVSILIRDEDGSVTERRFELINEAISTELESDYVERISSLGQALYGKKANDTFTVIRKNQPSLTGIIAFVNNTNTLEKEKHR